MTTHRSRAGKVITIVAGLAMMPLAAIGTEVMASDYDKPVFEFQSKLAEKGNAKAQYFLAQMYEQGRGTEANPEMARHWYEKAEQNGYDPLAQDSSVY